MVNCRYTVTADIYEDLIELQIRLKNRTPSQQLKFWGLNVGFLIAAILFLLLERDYSIVLRILLFAAAAAAAGRGAFRMFFTRLQAKRTVGGYLKQLDDGYLGPHHLYTAGPSLLCRYGTQTKSVSGSAIQSIIPLKSCAALVADGVIFDAIPIQVVQETHLDDLLLRFAGTVFGVYLSRRTASDRSWRSWQKSSATIWKRKLPFSRSFHGRTMPPRWSVRSLAIGSIIQQSAPGGAVR